MNRRHYYHDRHTYRSLCRDARLAHRDATYDPSDAARKAIISADSAVRGFLHAFDLRMRTSFTDRDDPKRNTRILGNRLALRCEQIVFAAYEAVRARSLDERYAGMEARIPMAWMLFRDTAMVARAADAKRALLAIKRMDLEVNGESYPYVRPRGPAP